LILSVIFFKFDIFIIFIYYKMTTIYNTKSIGSLLLILNKTISELQKMSTSSTGFHGKNKKIRFLIKELKLRDLSQLQMEKFNKLIIRYAWI
jgi:hypothetical protein